MFHGVEQATERFCLRGLYEVRLGIKLYKIVDVRIVLAVASDQTHLGRKTPDFSATRDSKQVLRVVVVRGDARAIEIVVQVLDLLISREEHKTAASLGDGE
jgi:hypothetical protein